PPAGGTKLFRHGLPSHQHIETLLHEQMVNERRQVSVQLDALRELSKVNERLICERLCEHADANALRSFSNFQNKESLRHAIEYSPPKKRGGKVVGDWLEFRIPPIEKRG